MVMIQLFIYFLHEQLPLEFVFEIRKRPETPYNEPGPFLFAEFVEQAGKTKADTYKKTREYAAKFKEINGSVYCKELKGVETGKILAPCDKCILDAVELAEQFLKEN